MFLLNNRNKAFLFNIILAPPCTGFSRQEYWSGLPFPSPGGLPNPEIEPLSPTLSGRFFTTEPSGKHEPLGYFQFEAILMKAVRNIILQIFL